MSLGLWQLYRLSWKLDLIIEIENSLINNPVELSKAKKKNYLRIKTSGKVDFEKQIYLYNLNESGIPGFEVINPIVIDNENYLINRGWINFDKKDKSEINLITNKILWKHEFNRVDITNDKSELIYAFRKNFIGSCKKEEGS